MGAQKHIVEGIEVWCLQDGAKSFDAAVFPDGPTPCARKGLLLPG